MNKTENLKNKANLEKELQALKIKKFDNLKQIELAWFNFFQIVWEVLRALDH